MDLRPARPAHGDRALGASGPLHPGGARRQGGLSAQARADQGRARPGPRPRSSALGAAMATRKSRRRCFRASFRADQMATAYHIYTNTGAGDPINYASPVATVSALTWTSSALSYPGTWSFGVRAFDTVSGLEEQNLDCSVTMRLARPVKTSPTSRSLPSASGLFPWRADRYESSGLIRSSIAPGCRPDSTSTLGLVVRLTTRRPPRPSCSTQGIANSFVANLTGLTDGTTYTIGGPGL